MRKLSLLLISLALSCAALKPAAPISDPTRAHQLTKDQQVEVYVKGTDGKLYPATIILHRGAWCAEDFALKAKK